MAPSNIGYSLREAGHHFKRNLGTSFGAVITIFLSLFIIGIFAMGSAIVAGVVGSVEDQVTIQAFLSDDAGQDQVNALQSKIGGWGEVDTVSYKSKDEAREEYNGSMTSKNAEDAVAALDDRNPFPASIVIKLRDPQQVQSVAQRIVQDADYVAITDEPDNPAASVLYGQGTVERLFSITNILRAVAIALVAMLVFVAFVFINNTIRLSISARRREIAIERLVGASNGFIRGPFVTEGVLQAIVGAALSIAALEGIRRGVLPIVAERISFLSFDIQMNVLVATYVLIVVMGLVIGLFGSAIAMRRYLKV